MKLRLWDLILGRRNLETENLRLITGIKSEDCSECHSSDIVLGMNEETFQLVKYCNQCGFLEPLDLKSDTQVT